MQICANISVVLLSRLQGIDPHGKKLLWKSALGLGLDKLQAGILEDGLKLLISPGGERHVRRHLVSGCVWTGCNRAMSNLPRYAAVLVVEKVDTTGADVFLDHDEPIPGGQDRLASFQVLDQLFIFEMTHTPLIPYEVVFNALIRPPFLQADVVDPTDAALVLQGFGEFRYGLDDVDLL